ncbi:MAG: alkaline phosphatase [Bacteroidales bacterium]
MRRNIILISIFIITITACTTANLRQTSVHGKKVKNVILFIGDGMGTAQMYAAITESKVPLAVESFPVVGFSKTYSYDKYVTDSGAGGTAIACGTKTRNGMIGVGPDSTKLESIIEIAHRNGLATGVLSTSAITHATPASFVAHNSGRGNYEDIARDFLSGSADVFMGGGENHFRKRKDSTDLSLELRKMGYDFVTSLDEMKKSTSSKIAALLAKEHMPKASEGRDGQLAEMVRKAISTLSQDKDGFFMMVEGSMIDWGGHAKDLPYVTSEVIDMDKAIAVAMEFADNDGETLIVVTADHETGGLILTGGSIKDHKVEANFVQSGEHTGVMVPVYAYGQGAANFSGIHENTFFLGEWIKLLRLKR